ncbi:MAG TPA: hypothetical protein VK783_02660 [Bacteroidia bacterium]|jgi:hypothetical protein|nr:hypothetical protein [Bacteroidia bacterium]
MKTEKELNQDILNITMTIEEKFPELSKYIGEMMVNISDTVGPNAIIKNLMDYYDSLDSLLRKYTLSHNCKQTLV